MWRQKNIIHLNSDSMVKDWSMVKYGSERSERSKTSHLHLSCWVKCLGGLGF